jgi:hypothetical protein
MDPLFCYFSSEGQKLHKCPPYDLANFGRPPPLPAIRPKTEILHKGSLLLFSKFQTFAIFRKKGPPQSTYPPPQRGGSPGSSYGRVT